MPYLSLAPPRIVPLILLDSYQCHIMALVMNVIQDLGCKVVHIPGGCTGLVQPLDVAIISRSKHAFVHAGRST
jgi:hypothetical protein